MTDKNIADYFSKHCRKDLELMMSSLGSGNVLSEKSVDYMLNGVVDFIQLLCKKSTEVGKNNRISVDNVLAIVRSNPVQLERAVELLSTNKIIIEAKTCLKFNRSTDSTSEPKVDEDGKPIVAEKEEDSTSVGGESDDYQIIKSTKKRRHKKHKKDRNDKDRYRKKKRRAEKA